MTEIVTKDELETPRSAAELLDWVLGALARFNTKELRAAAREGKHFAKELTDEALPIGLFARIFYGGSADVLVSLAIGSQQYDATVEDRRQDSSTIRHIEVTVSDRNYSEALRMEILNAKGAWPLTVRWLRKARKGSVASWKLCQSLRIETIFVTNIWKRWRKSLPKKHKQDTRSRLRWSFGSMTRGRSESRTISLYWKNWQTVL